LACGYLTKNNIRDIDLDIAKVWASKLKTLDLNQRIFVKKAINDVLFEAQLGTLHRNSIQFNSQSTIENYSHLLSTSTNFSYSLTSLISHSWVEQSTITSAKNAQPPSETMLHTYFTNFNEKNNY